MAGKRGIGVWWNERLSNKTKSKKRGREKESEKNGQVYFMVSDFVRLSLFHGLVLPRRDWTDGSTNMLGVTVMFHERTAMVNRVLRRTSFGSV